MNEPKPGTVGWDRREAERVDDEIRYDRARQVDGLVKQLVGDYHDLMLMGEGERRAQKYRIALDSLIAARDHLRGYSS